MAKMTIYTDDFSGQQSPDVMPDFKFSVGSDRYVIDITPESEKLLRDAIAPFTDRARIVMTGKTDPRTAAPPCGDGNLNGGTGEPSVYPGNETIRAWWGNLTTSQLNHLGIPAPPASGKGKIPKAVVQSFPL